ncbi:sensor histidine kinase [Chryseobacterium shandongense]|uniref:Sensor histidine kinase n=1 Tax=Chryseobacterium shandongense TaxID=1493872 RepID=A0AAD1DKK3_9FLAO|nr:histidine kinase [Chryseobacterium shandongense]AZA85488.1 sensor histidine kinase [Chryseobacterium shandongense]AZA97595.1 sensor histidine kinase [Chryseobacterium shandongense]
MLFLYMVKKYQIRWLLILTFFISLFTALMGDYSSQDFKWWYSLNHFAKVFLPLSACWLLHGYFLTNNFKKLSGYLKHLLSIVMGFIILLAVSFVSDFILPKNYLFSKEVGYEKMEDINAHLGSSALFSVLCFIIFYNRQASVVLKKTQNEKNLLEKSHLMAQLLSLQQQISPHFLFNSLSTLKTMVKDENAKNYIVKLAGVYRYVLSLNERYLTSLEDELEFITSYIHILHERFQNSLIVEIKIPTKFYKYTIPSLSLQLLIENAIKHNVFSSERPLLITVFITDSGEMVVENNFQPKMVRGGQSGTGLKNIIERYKLLTGRPVDISQKDQKFVVTIPLLEYEDNYHRR